MSNKSKSNFKTFVHIDFVIIILFLLYGNVLEKAECRTQKDAEKVLNNSTIYHVEVDVDKPFQHVNPLFFGVNTILYVEDDQSCSDGKIAKLLKEMPCRIIRYPGGELSDNYLWKTHRFDDPSSYPQNPRAKGPQTMDTDEFIKLCRDVGAEPLITVNIENGFLNKDFEKTVQDAVDWITYCNKTRGYNVKYWEMGNECSYITTRYPLTAHEYSHAVLKVAKALKAVDPAIKIMACGPVAPNTISGNEYIPKTQRDWFITLDYDRRREVLKKYKSAAVAEGASPAQWWPTLIDTAGDYIDIFDFHQKFEHKKIDYEKFVNNPALTDRTKTLPIQFKKFLNDKLPGRDILISNSEGLLGPRAPDSQSQGMEIALIVSEVIGQSLSGGIDIATYWPLRHYTEKSYWRGLIDYQSNEALPAYYVFQMYSSHIGDELLAVKSSSPYIYVCAGQSKGGDKITIILTNKTLQSETRRVRINLIGSNYPEIEAVTLSAPKSSSTVASISKLPVEKDSKEIVCNLPPHSVTMIQVSR